MIGNNRRHRVVKWYDQGRKGGAIDGLDAIFGTDICDAKYVGDRLLWERSQIKTGSSAIFWVRNGA